MKTAGDVPIIGKGKKPEEVNMRNGAMMSIAVATIAGEGAVGIVRVNGVHAARIVMNLQENRNQKHPAAYMDKKLRLYTR